LKRVFDGCKKKIFFVSLLNVSRWVKICQLASVLFFVSIFLANVLKCNGCARESIIFQNKVKGNIFFSSLSVSLYFKDGSKSAKEQVFFFSNLSFKFLTDKS
jgi:hypothetical protein